MDNLLIIILIIFVVFTVLGCSCSCKKVEKFADVDIKKLEQAVINSQKKADTAKEKFDRALIEKEEKSKIDAEKAYDIKKDAEKPMKEKGGEKSNNKR
jgi:hypothetical protein